MDSTTRDGVDAARERVEGLLMGGQWKVSEIGHGREVSYRVRMA